MDRTESGAGPSDLAIRMAVEAATAAVPQDTPRHVSYLAAKTALAYSHDRALGLDRSVCLRDVVEALHELDGCFEDVGETARAFIEREIGGSA